MCNGINVYNIIIPSYTYNIIIIIYYNNVLFTFEMQNALRSYTYELGPYDYYYNIVGICCNDNIFMGCWKARRNNNQLSPSDTRGDVLTRSVRIPSGRARCSTPDDVQNFPRASVSCAVVGHRKMCTTRSSIYSNRNSTSLYDIIYIGIIIVIQGDAFL